MACSQIWINLIIVTLGIRQNCRKKKKKNIGAECVVVAMTTSHMRRSVNSSHGKLPPSLAATTLSPTCHQRAACVETSTTTQTYNYNVVHPQLLGIWYELLLPDSFVHVSLLMWDVTYDPLSSVRQAKPRVTSDSVIFAQLFCVVDSFCKQKFFFLKKSCCTKRWKGS